jgi:hypothetical protein
MYLNVGCDGLIGSGCILRSRRSQLTKTKAITCFCMMYDVYDAYIAVKETDDTFDNILEPF